MKQKTATKALRWLAALALAGGVMTAMSATVWAENYPLWVGGTQVSEI